jgi:hypothetical protein
MNGIGFIIPGNGPGATTERVPTPLPSAGEDTYTHRYSGLRLKGADGAAITDWVDSGSKYAPLSFAGGAGTVAKATDTYPYAVLNGRALSSFEIEAYPFTVGVVVRKTALSQGYLKVGGINFQRAGNGAFQIGSDNAGTGGSGTPATAGYASNAWTIVVATLNGPDLATQTLRAGNAAEVTSQIDPSVVTNPAPLIGSVTAGQSVDVLELIVWSKALTATQRGKVHDALKAAYPSLNLD